MLQKREREFALGDESCINKNYMWKIINRNTLVHTLPNIVTGMYRKVTIMISDCEMKFRFHKKYYLRVCLLSIFNL